MTATVAAAVAPAPALSAFPVIAPEPTVPDPAVFQTEVSISDAAAEPAPVAPRAGLSDPTTPPFCNSQPISAPTFVRLLKLCISVTVLLFSVYFTVKNIYPVLMELIKPGSTAAAAKGKDAPLGVKVLLQTRGVVAKSNANVDTLNNIIAEASGEKIALPELPAPPVAPKPVIKPEPLLNLDALHNSIENMKINGVVGGKTPRIVVDGLLVSLGGVVDPARRLRFVSLDEVRRIIVFSNGVQTVEKPY